MDFSLNSGTPEGVSSRTSRVNPDVPPRRFTVSELTARIRGVLEPSFGLVWVQGEISNYKPASSGHVYFSLKDGGANISAAVFGWGARRRSFDLKDGLQVACRGKITVYPPRGSYQLVIDHIEPLGAGALQAAFERLKAQLSAEGLFDSQRKRPLPRFPKRIAVITSPTGAVIQDILNILKRRAPQIQVLVVPTLVQGEGAADQILQGLETVNRHSLAELIVVARGGGSMEDLWSFNHEALVRAIASSKIPVISAVGHEVDFTLSDFAADLRAPTPSAAAEILSSQWVDVASRLKDAYHRLNLAHSRQVLYRKNLLTHIAARLVSPRDKLREQAQRNDELSHRLLKAIEALLVRRRAGLEQWAGKLDALSPLRVLERGYTLVRDPEQDSVVVRSAKQVKPKQELEITFYDGKRMVRAT
ncbi:MAG: exodeoxyribonuclease VII large subunit [Bdellovibrio sp.]|nr:exodeoxyribonuclease VII large subunit [Bdellovibrio sp.]